MATVWLVFVWARANGFTHKLAFSSGTASGARIACLGFPLLAPFGLFVPLLMYMKRGRCLHGFQNVLASAAADNSAAVCAGGWW